MKSPNPMNRKGFTLIELLIVVVIIGILAAIAIPRFGQTRNQAYVSAMKTDLRNLQTAQELFYADASTATQYSYANALTDLDVDVSSGVSITINAGDATGWSATASHDAEPALGGETDVNCYIYVGDVTAVGPDNLPPGVVGCDHETFTAPS